MRSLSLRSHWRWRHVPYLLDQELPLVDELLVIRPVLQEVREECKQLLAVHQEDLLDGNGLVWVCDEYFEDMETLVLHHLAIVPKEVHADLEMLAAIDISSHDTVIGAVE